MKRFTSLLLLVLGVLLSLSSCTSEPKGDALTGSVWTLNSQEAHRLSTTKTDLKVTFLRPGQASIYVSYAAKAEEQRDSGSSRYEGAQSTTKTTSYTYRNGIVRLHPLKELSEDNSLRPSRKLEQLITLLTSEARVDLEAGTMTFHRDDPKKAFILRRTK